MQSSIWKKNTFYWIPFLFLLSLFFTSSYIGIFINNNKGLFVFLLQNEFFPCLIICPKLHEYLRGERLLLLCILGLREAWKQEMKYCSYLNANNACKAWLGIYTKDNQRPIESLRKQLVSFVLFLHLHFESQLLVLNECSKHDFEM